MKNVIKEAVNKAKDQEKYIYYDHETTQDIALIESDSFLFLEGLTKEGFELACNEEFKYLTIVYTTKFI